MRISEDELEPRLVMMRMERMAISPHTTYEWRSLKHCLSCFLERNCGHRVQRNQPGSAILNVECIFE